ncbi:MAG: hypothetical protein DRG63_01295 [Deltaproteobacteria bacterium]|nr:MAG: hypothetical protein DRG63_01295 [Deltaproteobacteria bacterium]RLB24493.1 MAG: hypothetical protein DRG76_01325 [Deltaproteobacteria bacterium]
MCPPFCSPDFAPFLLQKALGREAERVSSRVKNRQRLVCSSSGAGCFAPPEAYMGILAYPKRRVDKFFLSGRMMITCL